MSESADIGFIGLGVMGRNLVLNMTDHGHRVAVYNRTASVTSDFANSEEARDRPIIPCETLQDLITALKKPRAVMMMVKAGEAVDLQIEALQPLLATGDLIIDGGNSHYLDTLRRAQALEQHGLEFLGAGVSGGETGARLGPSIMVGGTRAGFDRVRRIFMDIAAKVDDVPCCAYLGPGAAGHFVKTIHNGIEYADMQLIAEVYAIMKATGLSYSGMQALFSDWNQGELNSYLIEITADILGKSDPETGQPILEVILDRAGQKGTGQWASVAALELGVPAPTIVEAVCARSLSALKDERVAAEKFITAVPMSSTQDEWDLVAALAGALLVAKVCAYAQGFAVMKAASEAYQWQLPLGDVSTIWRGGCIIRARFLDKIKDAFDRDARLNNLLVDGYFRELLHRRLMELRRVVASAAIMGIAAPALSSALAYFDAYRSSRLPANLIQAQRDYFGAHTYERVDKPGTFHTDWS